MTIVVAELYEALIAAGAPCEKARKAAKVRRSEIPTRPVGIETWRMGELKRDVASLDRRLSGVAGDVLVLKWMLGFVLTFQVAIVIKLFVL